MVRRISQRLSDLSTVSKALIALAACIAATTSIATAWASIGGWLPASQRYVDDTRHEIFQLAGQRIIDELSALEAKAAQLRARGEAVPAWLIKRIEVLRRKLQRAHAEIDRLEEALRAR